MPDKLNSLSLNHIPGNYILTLLRDNNNNLIDIEELKIMDSNFEFEDYESLIDLFIVIGLDKNIYDFYEQIPLIFKNIPSLIELDISNNKYKEKLFKNPIFENIRIAIPQKLLSLKIFNSNIPITKKTFTFLTESFGLVLDLDNNYPKIDKELDTIDLFLTDEDNNTDNSFIFSEYISDENDENDSIIENELDIYDDPDNFDI